MLKLYIITDKDNKITDISTRKENLSRGYTFPDYHEYFDVIGLEDVRVGDMFDGKVLTPNKTLRQVQTEQEVYENKIQVQIRVQTREIAISDLKAKGELPQDYN